MSETLMGNTRLGSGLRGFCRRGSYGSCSNRCEKDLEILKIPGFVVRWLINVEDRRQTRTRVGRTLKEFLTAPPQRKP